MTQILRVKELEYISHELNIVIKIFNDFLSVFITQT